MPRNRKTVAPGISKVGRSFYAKVQVGSGRDAVYDEKPFPFGTPLKEMRDWIDERRVDLRKEMPARGRGTIEAEVPTYLDRCAKRPASLSAKHSEMKAWIAEIGTLRRHQVKPKHIDATIAKWLGQRVAKKTVLNRCRTLHHFYVTMADDRRARSPLDNVDIPQPARRQPKHVPASLVVRTEKRLRAAIEDARRYAKHFPTEDYLIGMAQAARARFMVFATTGIRPSQLMRLTPEYVDLRRRVVDIAAGKGGEPIIQAMNDEQLAAWRAFADAEAWGSYDASRFRRRLRAAGWPAGLRPYEMKHAVGIRLAEQDADHEDIKEWYGHTDIKTVKIYTGRVLARVRKTAAKLENRFGWASPAKLPRRNGGARRESADTGGDSKKQKSA